MMRISRGIWGGRILALLVAACLLIGLTASSVQANFLTRILGEAGESAGDAGKLAARKARGPHDLASARIAQLPERAKAGALAVAVTPEGHWTFRNGAGETVTAAGPDEIAAAFRYLTPAADAVPGSRQSFYFSEDAAFAAVGRLDELPTGAQLRLASPTSDYRLLRIGTGKDARLEAEIRPNVLIALDDRALFRETLWQLQRPIKPAEIRVLSLQPGAARSLPKIRAKVTGEASTLPKPEEVDPFGIKDVLAGIRGQTVIVTGRTEGIFLRFQPSRGAEQTVLIEDLMQAARRNDVELFILEASTTRQPGNRNLVWQVSEVSGLANAMKAANRGDFLNALGERRSHLLVSVDTQSGRHVALSARPVTRVAAPEGGGRTGTFIDGLVTNIVSNITGEVVTAGGQANLRSADYQKELDARIVPGINSNLQFAYIALMILGLMGLSMVRAWWERIWPMPPRNAVSPLLGYLALRGLRLVLMLLIFMPLVAVAAFPAAIALTTWNVVCAPFRWWSASRAA